MTQGGATTIGHAEPTARPSVGVVARAVAPGLAIWLVAGTVLAQVTGRVVDWFVMTDELLYERLAISVARTGSPLPAVHGEAVANFSQLYPLLIAPFFRGSLVPEALHDVHVLNAFLMTSAAVPAYLLARRVTGSAGLGSLVALLSASVPWLVYSSLLLTEVVAYPAFLWALLGIQRAVASPRLANDALALLGIGVATLARTQFLALAAVLALALLADPTRPRLRRLLSGHRLLVGVYVALGLVALALAVAGRLADALGTYATAAEGDIFPPGTGLSFAEHLAAVALAVAVLPFLVGVGWMTARLARPGDPERSAFAAVGTVTLLAMTLVVTSFDLRFTGLVSDRYLFYVVPVVLVAFAAALVDPPWPRLALAVPTVLLAVGFAGLPLPTYEKLNADRPLAVVYEHVADLAESPGAARATLAIAAVVGAVLLAAWSGLVRRRTLAAVLGAVALVALPAQTGAAFARLFAVDGTSGRPLTLDQGVVFNWIDRTVGPGAAVTAVPYPVIPGDYWAGMGYWWDVEFWNASVTRAAWQDAAFGTTPGTFPKLDLRFDPTTGRANATATPYVAQASGDARFRIAGTRVETQRGVDLIEAEQPWRAEWTTNGLYADGWTRPGTAATIRVFAPPGGEAAVTRLLTVMLRAPGEAERPYRLASELGTTRGTATADAVAARVSLCVPASGFAEATLEAEGATPIYGVPRDSVTAGRPREGGVYVVQIALADELGGPCAD